LETFSILENRSLRRVGRLREVIATGGSTVERIESLIKYFKIYLKYQYTGTMYESAHASEKQKRHT